jgi:CheY-like chemotaxis protein
MSLRVLVVDDNVDMTTTLSLLCQFWGHEVHVVHDGPSAIEAALRLQPDVLLLDIGLPRMNGFEVAARLRGLPGFERTLIIGTSGYGRDRDYRRASEVGIDLYLVKPFEPSRLEEAFASRRPAPPPAAQPVPV